MHTKTERISLRVSKEEKRKIISNAKKARQKVGQFLVSKGISV